ncbi:hypothetical protein AB0N87_41555 [Streptomyces sp. NPDC093228]|nr:MULTISPECIES: hypothetical protein [unclassified Streptomyces]MDX3264338.1 hypothetical protein [Streptomyces sp. MI02-2A]
MDEIAVDPAGELLFAACQHLVVEHLTLYFVTKTKCTCIVESTRLPRL